MSFTRQDNLLANSEAQDSGLTEAVPKPLKVCTKCDSSKALTEFDKNKSKADGHDSRCKKCVSQAKAKSYKKKERARKELSKFSSVIIGQPSEAIHQEFARSLGIAVKEFLDEADK